MTNSKISGLGSFLPEKMLTNFDFEKMVDTSNEWILQRTGIRKRHICQNETLLDMALSSSRNALEDAGLTPSELDMIIVVTSTPDYYYPSVSCRLQKALEAYSALCLDLSASACTGFVYGLDMARRYIATGGANRILLVSSEQLSRLTDYTDRTTCVLFGDASGACIVQASDTPGIISSYLASDASNWEHLYAEIPGKTKMNGSDIYKFAVRVMPESIDMALKSAGKKIEDLDWIIPHQANMRIIQSVIDRYKLPKEKVVVYLPDYGNTSSASIPLCLDLIYREGKLKPGDLIMLVAFGAGMTYGAVLLQW